MTDKNDQNPANPANVEQQTIVLGQVLPEELAQLGALKTQAEQIVHQIGVNRVQEHRLMNQLRQVEKQTNQVVMGAGKRLSIPDGTAWSVTSDGKAIQVGAPSAAQAKPTLVPTPDDKGASDVSEG